MALKVGFQVLYCLEPKVIPHSSSFRYLIPIFTLHFENAFIGPTIKFYYILKDSFEKISP